MDWKKPRYDDCQEIDSIPKGLQKVSLWVVFGVLKWVDLIFKNIRKIERCHSQDNETKLHL